MPTGKARTPDGATLRSSSLAPLVCEHVAAHAPKNQPAPETSRALCSALQEVTVTATRFTRHVVSLSKIPSLLSILRTHQVFSSDELAFAPYHDAQRRLATLTRVSLRPHGQRVCDTELLSRVSWDHSCNDFLPIKVDGFSDCECRRTCRRMAGSIC